MCTHFKLQPVTIIMSRRLKLVVLIISQSKCLLLASNMCLSNPTINNEK